jgi:hypothetical protein
MNCFSCSFNLLAPPSGEKMCPNISKQPDFAVDSVNLFVRESTASIRGDWVCKTT